MSSTAAVEFDIWQPAGSSVRIDSSRAVMEELRFAATDGFNRLAHGGLEIGGVLFGVHEAGVVKILAQRSLECEYSFGPSFTLSDKDRRGLEELLAAPETAHDLHGMSPVGWYHSHTRSQILLSPKDIELYQTYFPELWQVALVLRPNRFDPVRAGFFVREPDGSIQADSTRQEFVIAPPCRIPNFNLVDDQPTPVTASRPGPKLVEAAQTSGQIAGALAEEDSQTSVQTALVDLRSQAASASSSGDLVLLLPQMLDSVPTRRRRGWIWSLAAAAMLLLVSAALWMNRSNSTAGLSLRIVDQGGQLRIDWNHLSPVIQKSEGGTLEIEDGPVKMRDDLSRENLRAGSVTYLRTTGAVLVRLLVRGANASSTAEMARFLGPPLAKAPPVQAAVQPPAPDRAAGKSTDQHNDEVASARERQPDRAGRQDAKRSENGPQIATAPPRRLLILPPPPTSHKNEAALPAPPTLTASAPAPVANSIPHLPSVLPQSIAPVLLPPAPAPVVTTPAANAPTATAPEATKAIDPGPTSGKIIWTGKLAKNGAIQILGNHALQGHITGSLPGVPVRVEVFPSELTEDGLRIYTADPKMVKPPEAPGAQNGWNRTVYVLNPKKAGEIRVMEAPSAQNSWGRLSLRAERSDYSIVVVHWEQVGSDVTMRGTNIR